MYKQINKQAHINMLTTVNWLEIYRHITDVKSTKDKHCIICELLLPWVQSGCHNLASLAFTAVSVWVVSVLCVTVLSAARQWCRIDIQTNTAPAGVPPAKRTPRTSGHNTRPWINSHHCCQYGRWCRLPCRLCLCGWLCWDNANCRQPRYHEPSGTLVQRCYHCVITSLQVHWFNAVITICTAA